MNAAPHDEGPVRPVPEAAEQHRRQQVAVGLTFAETIAAERNVQVVAEPRAQADVPAAPEALQTRRQVRLPEVHHEVKAEELRAAARDIAVAAEVTVDLPGEGVRADEGARDVWLAEPA